jgi:hypothetical protein
MTGRRARIVFMLKRLLPNSSDGYSCRFESTTHTLLWFAKTRLCACGAAAPQNPQSIVAQRFIAKINQHKMVLVVEPLGENSETSVAGPG